MLRVRLLTVGLIIIVFGAIGAINPEIGWVKTALGDYQRSSLIRLHVIANSDSREDQLVKLKVRDRIIKATEPILLQVEDPLKAEALIRKHQELLVRVAQDELRRNGRPMAVKIYYGKFPFPDRTYPFGVLPAGDYKAVRVILGAGKGKNWWCVLYPPLCLLSPDAPTLPKAKLEHPKVEYRLKVLEQLVTTKHLSMDPFWQGWGELFRAM